MGFLSTICSSSHCTVNRPPAMHLIIRCTFYVGQKRLQTPCLQCKQRRKKLDWEKSWYSTFGEFYQRGSLLELWSWSIEVAYKVILTCFSNSRVMSLGLQALFSFNLLFTTDQNPIASMQYTLYLRLPMPLRFTKGSFFLLTCFTRVVSFMKASVSYIRKRHSWLVYTIVE